MCASTPAWQLLFEVRVHVCVSIQRARELCNIGLHEGDLYLRDKERSTIKEAYGKTEDKGAQPNVSNGQ